MSTGGGDRFHRYNATARWMGSTAGGYEEYPRHHEVILPSNSISLDMSADAAFHGQEELLNPELMLIAAVVSCQLLSFLAVAARSQIEVVHYEDTGEAMMPDVMGRTGITNITLNPRITVRGEVDTARIKRLVELAHQECYVANSLKSLVILNPEITVLEAGADVPSHVAAPQVGGAGRVTAGRGAVGGPAHAASSAELADAVGQDLSAPGHEPLLGEPEERSEGELAGVGTMAAPEEGAPGAFGIDGDGGQSGGEEPTLGTPAAATAPPDSELRPPARLGAGGGAARRPAPRTRAVLQRFVDDDEGYQQWVSDHPDGYVLHTSRGSRGQPLMLHRPNCKIISGVNEDGSELPQASLKLASTSPDPIESWCQQIMRTDPDLCEECMG